MENMNDNVVMNNEVDTAVETDSTKPKAGSVLGTVALGACTIYGAVQLGKKCVGWVKGKIGAGKAKKVKDDDAETTAEDITDKE